MTNQFPSPAPMPPSSHGVPVPPPKRRRFHITREILSTVGLFLFAPLLALILTAFVFQFYRVDGSSMERTLHNNDRLIILKLPKTWANVTGGQYVPNRGEIVVFDKDSSIPTPDASTQQLIKRVVAIPGDRVVIKDGSVKVFTPEQPDGYDPDTELKINEKTTVPAGQLDITLKDDQVFVLGDNRDNSLDSRVFGPLRTDYIVGKLVLRVIPFESY